MTTASKTKPSKPKGTDVLARADELEAAWGEAEETARALAQEHTAALGAHRGVADELGRLEARQPELFDWNDEPIQTPDNPALELQQRARELPDLEQARLRAEHARRVAGASRQRWAAHLDLHGPEILRLKEAGAERRIDAVQTAILTALSELELYDAEVTSAEAVAHNCRQVDTRRIQGRDNAANLRRTLEGWTGRLPNPAKPAPLPSDARIRVPAGR